MSWGVDFASVDGNAAPNFAALKAAGASFCWIRASYVYYNPAHKAYVIAPDSAFQRDWANLKASGLVRGAYMFPVLEATQTAAEQVATFKHSVDQAGGLHPGVDFPPCLDIEFPGAGIAATGLDRAGVMKWLREAIAELRRVFKCVPMLYTSGRVWNDSDADCLGDPPAPDLVDCPLWLASYWYTTRKPAAIPPPDGPAPPVPHPWQDEFWIHQDQGDALGCPGFTSTVDISRFHTAKQGDHGGHVSWAQHKMQITADGAFGPVTEAHVQALQRAHGLAPSGVIDPATFAMLAWL